VKIKNQTNGMEMTYTLVAERSRFENRKISVTSNWERVIRESVGEFAEITVPAF
jgi:transcription elongation factor GreA